MEQIPGDDLYKRADADSVPVGRPADRPSHAAIGDKRNRKAWNDRQIELAVMNALHWDLAVPRDRVQVSVNRGWVTRQVRHGYERSKAEADARAMRGVAGVVNKIVCKWAE